MARMHDGAAVIDVPQTGPTRRGSQRTSVVSATSETVHSPLEREETK
jgi:hypothetical protein